HEAGQHENGQELHERRMARGLRRLLGHERSDLLGELAGFAGETLRVVGDGQRLVREFVRIHVWAPQLLKFGWITWPSRVSATPLTISSSQLTFSPLVSLSIRSCTKFSRFLA